ncbi:MAG: HD domain-containing protein [Desulfobacterales bacterium]|nr:HD domain-containing protein [Desulfobacterales bacterium]
MKQHEDKPLYNSRIIDTYLKYLKRQYPSVNIRELLEYAGMRSYEVADQNQWFTQEQINRFQKKLKVLTGNRSIAREAGRFAASPEAIGVMRQYMLGLVNPEKAYEKIGRAMENFTRSCRVESKMLSSNRAEITVTPKKGIQEQPFQCENRIGFFEAVTFLFTNRFANIEHPECIFNGDPRCRYIISWDWSLSSILKTARKWSIGLALAIPIACIWHPSLHLFILLSTAFVIVGLILTCFLANIEKNELQSSLSNLWISNEKLLVQMEINYKNALMVNEIGQVISRQIRIDDVLEQVIRISVELLGHDRGLLMLCNKDKTHLEFRAGFGYSKEQFILLRNTTFRLDNPTSKGVFVVSFREQKPFLINDYDEIEGTLSPKSLRFARKMGAQAFICCPIICDGVSIGILTVDNIKSEKPLASSDMSLLMGLAPVIGISLRNAELLESKTETFHAILAALVASIEARDPLTAGHSEKVTAYAVGICEEMGIDREYREMIRVAALLHDYGKIGVPDSILKKPGRLTKNEYELVKDHARKTEEILERVPFDGVYQEVPRIAGAHHEKIDGSGYPNGLKRDQIPLGAKIIAVADFFEAVTSKRHYRDPMPDGVAISMLKEGRGTHFDQDVTDAFLRYYTQYEAVDEVGTGKKDVISFQTRKALHR